MQTKGKTLDEIVPFEKQLVNLQGLGLSPNYDTTYVDNSSAPYNNSHCLYTTQAPGLSILYHNSTTKFGAINNSVWTYMLMSSITAGMDEESGNKSVFIFPNPTTSGLTIYSEEKLDAHNFNVQSITGQTYFIHPSTSPNGFTCDLSNLSAGIYFITLNQKTYRIIKN